MKLRDIADEYRVLAKVGFEYQHSPQPLARYIATVLRYDASLLRQRMLGEMKNPIVPAIVKGLRHHHRGVALHVWRNQKGRLQDSLSRLTLYCAMPAYTPTRGKRTYRMFGMARPTLEQWREEAIRLRENRFAFLKEGSHFLSKSMADYSPTAMASFVQKWRSAAISTEDPHLFLLISVIDANQRHLAMLSRRQFSSEAKQVRSLLRKWAAAVVQQKMDRQFIVASELTSLFAQMGSRDRKIGGLGRGSAV